MRMIMGERCSCPASALELLKLEKLTFIPMLVLVFVLIAGVGMLLGAILNEMGTVF